MNFNVYLDDEAAEALAALARETGKTRNAIVRQAVSSWLDRSSRRWPPEVRDWQGDADVRPFEEHRSNLLDAPPDPFEPRSPPPRRPSGRSRRGRRP